MKKISRLSTISSFIVLAFIVPQVAFAAWWNPFTWGVPKESGAKTQALENRVKELESMLATTSSSTVSQSTENASSSSTNETQKVVRASWWNPVSWNVFSWLPFTKKTQTVQIQNNSQPTASSTDSSAVSTQKAELELLKKEAQEAKVVAESERLKAEKAKAEAETAKAEAEKQRLQAENTKLKNEATAATSATDQTSGGAINQGTPCNGKYWAQCPIGQTFVCPQSGNAYCSTSQTPNIQTGKNYYSELKSKLTTLISIEKSFETWLQDTSDQFRSASLTLAGYNLGGLYGESRDAAIKLSNANVSVISEMLIGTRKWISYYQNLLDAINSDPKGFIDEATFNSEKIQRPTSLETEISGIKKSINSSLDSVLESLQFH